MRKTKNKYRLLSYDLTADTFAYGGQQPFKIKKSKSISNKDSCNTFILDLPNHMGTHIDCPNHFYNSGKMLQDYNIKDFIFLRPVVLECPKSASELVSEDDVKRNYGRLKRADALLLKTGFCRYRGSYKYSIKNPGIAPEAAEFIRRHLGNIKCVGIDTISVSPYQNRRLGRETHRIFFKDNFENEPVRLIEDMDLSGRLYNLKEVYVFPLFVKGIDSSPCAVVGILGKRQNGT